MVKMSDNYTAVTYSISLATGTTNSLMKLC